MGSITSRGDSWPPKPYKRFLGRNILVDQIDKDEVKQIRVSVEDYVWVYPGERHNGGSGVPTRWDEEAGPWQETAIRNLEDG